VSTFLGILVPPSSLLSCLNLCQMLYVFMLLSTNMATPQNLYPVLCLIAITNEVRNVKFGMEMVHKCRYRLFMKLSLYVSLLKHDD
jgi:hypothetical protein